MLRREGRPSGGGMYGLEAVHHSVFLASIWLSIPHMISCFLRETYYSKSILGSWFSVSQRLLSCKEEKALKPAQGRSKRVQIPWRQNGVRPHGTWIARDQQHIFISFTSSLSFCVVCLLCFSLCLPLSLSLFSPYRLCILVASFLPIILAQDT